MGLRVCELFTGIGSQSEALRRLGADFNVVAWSDIDPRAIKIYKKLHPECVPNLGDITKIESLPECDLLTYSSPCTDFSICGTRTGGEKGSGTQSSLIWEVHRLLCNYRERGCLPKYLLLENVIGLVSGKFKSFFSAWCDTLRAEFGYTSFSGILNAEDFNVPQSRNRVFVLSVLNPSKSFIFPKGNTLNLTLEDVKDVDCKKQYITKKQIESALLSSYNHAREFIQLLTEKCGCLTSHAAKQAYCVAEIVQASGENSQGYRIRSLSDVSFTLTSNGGGFSRTGLYIDDVTSIPTLVGDIVDDGGRGAIIVGGNKFHVRKLTPRECYRVMGWRDESIDKILSLGLYDTSHYFVCGNSIVVPCLMALFGEMLNQFEGYNIDWFFKVFGYSKIQRRLF